MVGRVGRSCTAALSPSPTPSTVESPSRSLRNAASLCLVPGRWRPEQDSFEQAAPLAPDRLQVLVHIVDKRRTVDVDYWNGCADATAAETLPPRYRECPAPAETGYARPRKTPCRGGSPPAQSRETGQARRAQARRPRTPNRAPSSSPQSAPARSRRRRRPYWRQSFPMA